MKTMSPFAAAAVLLLFASAAAGGDARYGTGGQPLTGQRYRTMLALAGHLHATALGALDGAIDEARRGTAAEGRFVASVRSFARGTGDFHRMIDAYEAAPFDVPPRVAAMAKDAGGMNDRLRAAAALRSTYGDWDAVIDVLGRMTALLAGGDVAIPAAYVAPPLSGPTLDQFRRLARELELSAAGAHEQARQRLGAYPVRGAQFLGELGHFAARSRDLRIAAESPDVHPQQITRLVDRLLAEARQADRTMREAEVFTTVWSDSGRTITILERMSSLVRS